MGHLQLLHFFCKNSCWVKVLGKHLGVRVWDGIAHFVIVEWKLFAFTCSVEIGKSLAWRVKVVDVGLEWLDHYKSKCFVSLNLLLGYVIQPISINQFNFPSPTLKFQKPSKVLFTPFSTSLRDPNGNILGCLGLSLGFSPCKCLWKLFAFTV